MTDKNHWDKKLDKVLERLNYLGMVIRNLKEREGRLITDVGDIDERLFKEIASYEALTEEMKKDFVMLLIEDAQRLADACVGNTNLCSTTSESLDKIEDLLDFMNKHESEDIKRSEEMQDLTVKSKDKINKIRKEMEQAAEEKEEEKKDYEQTQAMHRGLK